VTGRELFYFCHPQSLVALQTMNRIMQIAFEKYHGTGNDFVIIDNRTIALSDDHLDLFRKMCDRHFGIGADGLMLIQEVADADFEMVFYNPDRSKSLCGNGSRCAIKFAHALGMISKSGVMRTTDGLHDFKMNLDQTISVKMNDISEYKKVEEHWFIDSGSPHIISSKQDVRQIDLINEGRTWRYDPRFETINGANVNFVDVDEKDGSFAVRTYERGVEAETLSCGTGVTAIALALALDNKAKDTAILHTRGGELTVKFKLENKVFTNIWLQGAAEKIFTGTFHA